VLVNVDTRTDACTIEIADSCSDSHTNSCPCNRRSNTNADIAASGDASANCVSTRLSCTNIDACTVERADGAHEFSNDGANERSDARTNSAASVGNTNTIESADDVYGGSNVGASKQTNTWTSNATR
jgi:hypothetical protein